MINEIDFETFLFVSDKKYQIFLYDNKEKKNLYKEEIKVSHTLDFQNFSELSNFLDNNIYKIEKLVGNFIKDIILITENNENLIINVGMKKKNYDNLISKPYLENNLIELKDLIKKSYKNHTIMHMVILNYIIDGKRYSSYKNNLISKNLCLEVNFFSISNELIFELEKILQKFQIKISKYMCGNYVKNYFKTESDEISINAQKLKNGFNENEVALVPKNIENKGFFERFFQLFS